MITVQVTYKNQLITELLVKGHAQSAEKGKDLICAAVSSIVVGGANAITNPKCFAFQEQEGLFQIQAVCPINEHDKDVLKTILTQLKTVAEEFPKNVRIVEKGN